ncbi:MAG: glycerol kinase GlpK [Acidobacteriota bacterium]|nr:glycerol kinase GlpK [Acidobacteriota bacterium]
MKYVLAIDQGTTGSRAIAYDRKGRPVVSSYREFPQYFPRPGWVEHDPREIWASVRETVEEVLRNLPPGSIAAIGITNQRETTVLWDRRTGQPVHNAIVWQCRRTAPRCEALNRERGTASLVRRRTGLPIDAYFSATKVEWLIKTLGLRSRARRGEILFGTTDAWILWKLTGGRVHATDPTNASRTMLYDIDRGRFDEGLLDVFGVPAAMLPEVRPSSGEFGRTARAGTIPEGIPITGIAGDQQAALFGQACFARGTIKATYGTGCFILLNAGRARPDSRHGLLTTLACGPGGRTVYALEGSVFVAGAAIQWLRDKLGLLRTAAESQTLAETVPDNGGVYFVPAFVGLGAPYWDSDARGTIVGLTRGTERGHIVRAALESIAYATRDVLETMTRDSGLRVRDLRVDGGGAANAFLCRFQAGLLGFPVLRPATIETTSLGAAYLAGLAAGYWRDTDEIKRLWEMERRFAPEIGRAEAERLYAGWKDAVRRTLSPDRRPKRGERGSARPEAVRS